MESIALIILIEAQVISLLVVGSSGQVPSLLARVS